jgi:hypothetical protein
VLCTGVALLACGVALVALSVIAARADLWQIGLPAIVVGQAGLIIGFAMHFDGAWRLGTGPVASGEVADQATPVEYPAMGVRAMSDAAHASPHMLLSELKARLDQLVQQASPPAGS